MFGWNHIELYVDLATPASWTSRGLSLVDLDLDVVRTTDGRVELWDEDEFAKHQLGYGYPTEVIEAVIRTADETLRMVKARVDPFGLPPPQWLDKGAFD
jgi:protein associated with RNAse G/E